MSAARKVFFNCGEIIAACKAAKATGKPLSTVFSLGSAARPGPNGTKYMDLSASVPGKKGRLLVRVIKEKHVGQIAPLDEAEVARINAERSDKYGSMKVRDRHPTLNVQKYKTQIETDDQGRPTNDLPGDDQVSDYFLVVKFLDEFFYETMQERIADGRIILRDPRRKDYPANAVVVSSTKIVPLFQSSVSMESKKNPGAELVNPICRVNMKFDKDTGMPTKVSFFDSTKEYQNPETGKRAFEPLTFEGHPVTAHNVHKIASHSIFSGIVNLNAVCASNLGLSVPTGMEVVVVEPPVTFKVGVDDIFDDDDTCATESAAAPASADTPSPASADKSAAAPSIPEDDLADVVKDLDVAGM